jgi:hypothetical protein
MLETGHLDQSDLFSTEKALSPWELYIRGWQYYAVLMRGISQMGLHLLGNHTLPESYQSATIRGDQFQKPPSIHENVQDNPPIQNKTSLNRTEEIFSSLKKLSGSYISTNAPNVLQTLLEFVCLAYTSGSELRKHIKNIHAKYRFGFGNDDRQISLEIKNSGMRVFPGNVLLPDISIQFRDGEVMKRVFMAGKADILDAILKQDVVVDGNLTYLFKFIYLLNHLQNRLLGPT